MVRWLFQGFQECVFGVGGKLMRFVDDEHFVPERHWREPYIVPDVLDVIDAPVGCRVQLDYVDG